MGYLLHCYLSLTHLVGAIGLLKEERYMGLVTLREDRSERCMHTTAATYKTEQIAR